MSNFQPSLVIDESIATGWARVEIYGDKTRGQAAIPGARTVLGTMKMIHGVGLDQVDNRERTGGGGFFQMRHSLPDGTIVQAISNDGHDTIRIYPPPLVEKKEDPRKRKDDIDPGDYLWIGIRCKGERPEYALDVCLTEPDGTEHRGVVGTIFATTNAWVDKGVNFSFTGNEDDGYELERDDGPFEATSRDDLLTSMFESYGEPHEDLPPLSPNMQPGDHQGGTYILENGNFSGNALTFNWAVSGLYLQYWQDYGVGDFSQADPEWMQYYGPYDPAMDAEQNAGSEREGTMDPPPDFPQMWGWDAVFVLDPYEKMIRTLHPECMLIDKRKLVTKWLSRMREDGFFVQPGEAVKDGIYTLTVRAMDTPPHLLSSRSGDHIDDVSAAKFGVPDEPGEVYWYRNGYCDFREYMELVRDHPPLEVEVKVRIGRVVLTTRDGVDEPLERIESAPMVAKDFEFSISDYDDRDAATWPFGFYAYDDCLKDGGPSFSNENNFGVVEINVRGKTAEYGSLPVDRVWGTGPSPEYAEHSRRPAKIFIHTAFPPPDPADFPALAGRALYECLQAISAGVFGCSDLGPDLTEGECVDMFPADTSNILVYNATAGGGLSSLGPPTTEPEDYEAYSPPYDHFNFHWYYDKAIPYRNACDRTYGIVVTSVGGFFEMTQNFAGLTDKGFTNPDCC